MPLTRRPDPDPPPPRGVPRWLWPPPGATVSEVGLREEVDPSGASRYEVVEGERPGPSHLRVLAWLLDEHPRAPLPPGTPFEGEVLLSIARTPMAGGRIGHAYALNGGPLGAPAADGPRGVLWRCIAALLES